MNFRGNALGVAGVPHTRKEGQCGAEPVPDCLAGDGVCAAAAWAGSKERCGRDRAARRSTDGEAYGGEEARSVGRGHFRALPSIRMPALKMSDGPYGVRAWGASTACAAGLSLAAASDPEVAESVGRSITRDARARGVGDSGDARGEYVSLAF
jgi:hypothetical protein